MRERVEVMLFRYRYYYNVGYFRNKEVALYLITLYVLFFSFGAFDARK